MWSLRNILVLVLSFVLVSGCMPTESTESEQQQSWQVSLSVEGGIAGRVRVITADSDGSLSISNLRAANERVTQLPGSARQQLQEQVEEYLERDSTSADAEPPASFESRRCADCITYRLTVTPAEGKPLATQWDSMTPADQHPRLGGLLLEYAQSSVSN